MFSIFLGLSILEFVATMIWAIKSSKNQKKAMGIAFFGTLLAIGLLVFPLHPGEEVITEIVNTIFYVSDTPSMLEGFDILANAPQELYEAYKYILYLYCLLSPVFAVGVLVSFIGNLIDELRARMRTKKTVHIFSEINEKSVMLAKNLKNQGNRVILCEKEENLEYRERIKDARGIILKRTIDQINLKRYLGEVKIYAIAENEDKNLDETLAILEHEKQTIGKKEKSVTIYVFSSEPEAEVILDSCEKYGIRTILVNETQQMAYQVLEEVPLYKNAENKEISALIVGAGYVGSEFIKDILWCGQMPGYTLKIRVIDQDAETIQKRFQAQCPEIFSDEYDLAFYQADINNLDGQEILRKYCMDVGYIVVCMGEDDKNLNTAIALRRFYFRQDKKPLIQLEIRKQEKSNQVSKLKNEKGTEYEFYTFGAQEELYGNRSILNEKIEDLAMKVHKVYEARWNDFGNPDVVKQVEKKYYRIEYNKKSSRAAALHLKYKVYAIFGKEPEEIEKEEYEEAFKNRDLIDSLVRNEHDRWDAYMRTDGFCKASIEQVEAYYPITKNRANQLAKLHPALVPFDELDELSKNLEQIEKKEVDLKQSDYDIVEAIPQIFAKKEKKRNV